MIKYSFLIFVFTIAFCITSFWGQNSKLTIENIMKGEDFVGYLPKNHKVLPNDEVVFMWRTAKDDEYEWYLYNYKNI